VLSYNEDVRTFMADEVVISALGPETHDDKGHGRIEIRTCWVSQDVA